MDITGVYKQTLFRNEDNGYTVFSFLTKDLDEYNNSSGKIFCTGFIPKYTEDMPLKLTGDINYKQDNDTYVFTVTDSNLFSNERQLLINYLSGDAFNGIGTKTAEKIINFTGLDIFNFVENENASIILQENISELKGAKAADFIKILRNTNVQKQIYDVIAPYGGKYINAQKMYDKYGVDAMCKFNENPYLVGFESGMKFIVCDAYAMDNDFYPYDERRLKSLIYGILDSNETENGNTYMTLGMLHRALIRFCPNLAFKEIIPVSLLIPIISEMKSVIVSYDRGLIRIFKKKTWDEENKIAINIARLNKFSQKTPFSMNDVSKIEKSLCISYSNEQKQSFQILTSTGVKILTGGPGTGKSTVINGIIYAYKKMYPDNAIVLAAPTGRAAQRISEVTNMPASTLHRLLDVKPFGKTVTYKDLSSPIDASLIIVDEISMADTELMSMLFGAIQNGSLVILCGDVDQLPSVGAGNVLSDLLNAGTIEKYQLKTVFRQKNGSSIALNASNIKNGISNIIEDKDTELITVSSTSEIEQVVKDYISKYYDSNNIFKMQVLTTTKKDIAGTAYLNRAIQQQLLGNNISIAVEGCTYCIGDKIMMLRNNYEQGYFNGDMGVITEINHNSITVDIAGEPIIVKHSDFKDISLCYSCTVHKSQGAEFDTVIVVLPKTFKNMLQRNLFYTAVTRAKKKLIIVAEKDAVQAAVKNNDISIRYTDLKNKLINISK